jgi:hypothetical protein
VVAAKTLAMDGTTAGVDVAGDPEDGLETGPGCPPDGPELSPTGILTSASHTKKTGRLAASCQCRADSGHKARLASLFEHFALVNSIDVGRLKQVQVLAC